MVEVRKVAPETRYAPVQARSSDVDGHYMSAVVTTYDNWVDIGPFEERMAHTVFAETLARHAADIKLLVSHEHRAVPVGTPVDWQQSDRELVGTWKFGSAQAARDAHTAVSEGLLSAVSVGFMPGKNPADNDWEDNGRRVTRNQARLLEVSLVAVPANIDAKVVAVRTVGIPDGVIPKPTPRLDEARRIIRRLTGD